MNTITQGEHVLTFADTGDRPQQERYRSLDIGGTAVVHIYGPVDRLWIWGKATVFVHSRHTGEAFVFGKAQAHFLAGGRIDVGDHAVAFVSGDALVTATQWSAVHAGVGALVLAYGEAKIHAVSQVEVRLHGYATRQSELALEGNTSTYRPGYYVMR